MFMYHLSLLITSRMDFYRPAFLNFRVFSPWTNLECSFTKFFDLLCLLGFKFCNPSSFAKVDFYERRLQYLLSFWRAIILFIFNADTLL